MAVHGEAVLRARLCLGRDCAVLFYICSHCDRGQRYCSVECSAVARRRQRREANRRHQRSPEGRLDHQDRQREYRRRRAQRASQARVTDQGSQTGISPALSGCGEVIALPAQVLVAALRGRPSPAPRCCVCGRAGRFVNPFPHVPRRR